MKNIRAATNGLVDEVRDFLANLKETLPEIFRVRPSPKKPPGTKRIPFQGRTLELKIERVSGNGRSVIKATDDSLMLLRSPDDPRPPAAVLEEWYRARAREVLAHRVEHWSKLVGVEYRRILIKDQRTLWGSCSRRGNLNFNWRLVIAPPPVLEYVVVHELSHLKELNHSKRFWKLVSTWCPHHKDHRRWLRKHGRSLRMRLGRG